MSLIPHAAAMADSVLYGGGCREFAVRRCHPADFMAASARYTRRQPVLRRCRADADIESGYSAAAATPFDVTRC